MENSLQKLKKHGSTVCGRTTTIVTCLLALLAGFLFFEVSKRPLANPDEGRYSEIPREMLVSGDFTTPRLNGVKYFEKPPLFYWMQSACLATFGHTEIGARFMNTLMALLGCLITFWAGNLFFSKRCGVIAAMVLASSLLYYSISRIATLDMTVSVFISAALFSFFAATTAPTRLGRRILIWLGYTFCAAATMTKGIIGIGIPGGVILIWIFATKQWHLIRRFLSPLGILIFFILIMPWHILVSLRNPEFAWFYFIHEHLLRLTTNIHNRYQPFWFFIPIFMGGLFPWFPFFISSVGNAIAQKRLQSRDHHLLVGLLIWIGFVFTLFSFSQSKLIPYILPLMPPCALLIAYRMDKNWATKGEKKQTRPFFWQMLLGIGVSIALFVVPLPAHISPDVIMWPRIGLSLLFVGGAGVAWLLSRKMELRFAFIFLLVPTMASLLVLNHVSEHLQRPCVKTLALRLAPFLTPQTPVICFEFYPQELPFYLKRHVMISGWKGELAFGISAEKKTSEWIFSHDHVAKLWQTEKDIFVFLRRNALEAFAQTIKTPFHILGRHHNLLLVSKNKVAYE